MNKKKIGEKTDSLLEAEMIKEAKMIEESLLGNAANDFEISDEELDEAYQQFLKKMKAEGKLDEDFLISYVSLKKKKINPGTNMERQ